MDSSELVFASRIVSVDYYMAEPVAGLDLERSEFRKSEIKSVPVIRVFGSTPSGQTTCLHVHGVFSYLMIPYDGPDVVETHWSEIESYMHVLAARLDDALNGSGGKSKASQQRVFKIILLRGIPFYGYHAEEELFLKVYFYFPGDVKKAADILQNGMVLDRSYQVHEAHIPYILQYFLDYNLYGMNLIHARNCWFRLPIGKPDPISELPTIQRPDDVPTEEGKTMKGNHGAEEKNRDNSEDNFQAPTISQFRNFDWNLLRAKGLSGDSPNMEEIEQDGEFINLSVEKSDVTSTTQSGQKPRRSSQCFSCSDLCKSVISKTLTQDSTLINSPESTVRHSCPLHTLWSSETVPTSAKLPIDVARHSTCDIEVDVLAADIANRYELKSQSTSNPGIEAIWEDERSRRRERDEDSQIPLDHSQPRLLPDDLSERELHFFQMLYNSLDRYKEENSIRSFSESPSFTASSSSMKMSSSYQSHSQSNDLFASSGDTVTNYDDIISSGGSKIQHGSPIIISSGSSKTRDSESMDGTTIDEDISTLELMRQLDERESLESCIGAQRGNGPLDDDQKLLDPERCFRSQNRKMRQLSQSLRISPDSQLIDSFSNATQPASTPSDDEDVIDNFEMSQRWDSAIQDLLNDMSATEIEDDDIPQLDGTSDEQPKNTAVVPGRRPTSTKRQYAVRSKNNNADFIKNLINSTNSNTSGSNSPELSTKVQDEKDTVELETRENIVVNNVNSFASNQCTNNIPIDTDESKNDTHFSTKHNLPLKNTSNNIFEKDEKIDHADSGKSEDTKSENLILETRDVKMEENVPKVPEVATSEPISVTLTKRQHDDRTNVFSRILDESPGVTLYDNANLCKFTHTAVINLDQMSENADGDKYPISTLDGSLIKITSVPIDKKKSKTEKCSSDPPSTRKSRSWKKADEATSKEVAKPTRTRRPRLASKNSYLDNTLYETAFVSDFESEGESSCSVTMKASKSASKSTNTRKNKTKKRKDRRKKKEQVITKWIIVNRFKGVSSMRVGLWRIPDQKRVKLTTELLRMYELYSPRKVDITVKPVRPPFIHPPIKPRPMGRRSKHMLASLCLFGPLSMGSNVSSSGMINSPQKNVIENRGEAPVSSEVSMTEPSKGFGEPTISQEKNANSICESSSRGKHGKKTKNITTNNLKSNGENRTVKKDSPILEKMAFDLKRIEDNLNDQYPNLSNGNLQIEYGKEDLISLKETCVRNGKDTTVPKQRWEEETMVGSSEQNSFNYNGMPMLPLKISCCSADVAAMKQDTNASKTETGGLNLTGCCRHLDDQCKEGCKFINKTVKATTIEKEAGLGMAAEQQAKSAIKRNISGIGAKGSSKGSQVMKDQGMLNIDNIGEGSVALKGLCINLCRAIPPEVCGKEKCRMKIGEVEQSGKSGKKSKESKKSKKEARKRKIDKSERDLKSSHDGDRETKVSRSIVPVSSRTVEPICKRESPVLELESDCDVTQSQSDASLSDVLNCDNIKDTLTVGSSEPHDGEIGEASLVKKTEVKKMKHVSTGKDGTSITKVAVATNIESTVITKCGIATQEKKTLTAVTSTRRVYSPTKKVTRNSVTVKLNSIHPPTTMFTTLSDDSYVDFPPLNALMKIGYPPTPPAHSNTIHDPPRPWTPMKQKKHEPSPQDNADDILEELAESFGADGTKVLDIVDESLFNNINCFEELITGHGGQRTSADNQPDNGIEKMGSRAKDKNERMLEHFDKIFEDVTSCGSSKVSTSAVNSSRQFDEFEEETLMEFIDEMTSPTQLGNSNSSQMMSFPIAAPTPMEPNEVTNRNKETGPNKQPLPQVPYPVSQQVENLPRPHSTLPHASQTDNVAVRKQCLNDKWSMTASQDRPQSCFPGSSLPDVAQIQRPHSVMGHWNKGVLQEQNAVFNNSQMMKIHNNISSTNSMAYKSQNVCYASQNDPGYFVDPRSSSQHPMNHSPYPYSFNQHYRDPGSMPRPSSVMDNTPLQVFHTHVHHHHHVHSINNSNAAGPLNNVHDKCYSMDNKIGRQIFQTTPNDNTMDVVNNVKVEKIMNPTWPQSPMPAQENLHRPQGIVDQKAQFHSPEPSLLFSKSGQPVRMQSGLVQTLTYVNPNVPQNQMGARSNFYNFTGLDPKSEGIVQSSIVLPPQAQPYCDISSVLLKGSCQFPKWQQKNSRKSSTKVKNHQKGKVVKRKPKSNLSLSRTVSGCVNFDNVITSAKTPYGIMKQNSLNNLKKQKDNTPKSIERKRKTISDFRAPPDTPTISLSGWSSVDSKNDSEAFELSQDLFDSSVQSKSISDSSLDDKSPPFAKLPKFNEKGVKKVIVPDTLSQKSDVASESTSDPSVPPTPQIGEELILNSATGEWEVVPAELHKFDEENKICIASPGKLPTLNDSLAGFRKRTLTKCPDLSSDDDISNTKGKKNPKAGLLKMSFSAPEYMVSSVDLKSDSPRLKLTLKKTPSSRGKPKFSTLPSSDASSSNKNLQDCVINQSEVPKQSCDFEPSKADQSQSANLLHDFKPLKIVCTKPSADTESESDYRIDDSDSTDDASEVGSISEDSTTHFDDHMKTVTNMYVTKARQSPLPFCVTMDEFYVTNALVVLKDHNSMVEENGATVRGGKKSSASSKSNRMESEAADPKCGMVYSNDEFIDQNNSSDCGNNISIVNSAGDDISVDLEDIKQLLNDCCDLVANSNISIIHPTQVPREATSGKNTHPDGDKPQKKEEDNNKESASNSNNPTTSNRIRDDFDPPSPPENKQFLRKYSRPCFDDDKHFYVTSNKPPSPSQVMIDLLQTGQASESCSEEPFYGDKNDVQSTSNRLSNLPPYVKKPKPKKTISELSEHASLLPLEGGIQHWIVMATAQKFYTNAEKFVLREKTSSLLPENTHVWDHLDAASKLSQYPLLAKVFLNPAKGIIIRPAKQPPTREDVQNWLDEEKRKKLHKKSSERETKPAESVLETSLKKALQHSLISPKSSLRRSSSLSSPSKMKTTPRPRRVSFDVVPTSTQDDFKIIKRKRVLNTIKGSPNKMLDSNRLKSTQTSTSPSLRSISPFATGLSPVTPTTIQKNIWDSELLDSNQSPMTYDDGSSSAIQSLVGSSKQGNDVSIISLISGSFTPVTKMAGDGSSPRQCDASMKKQPQSTPNTSKQHSRAHKKLSYTPTMQRTSNRGNTKSISPISTKSTPSSKSTTLKKAVLVKNIPKRNGRGVLTDSRSPEDPAKSVQSRASSPYESPPLSLNTPRVGKKEGSQIDGPTLDNTHGFKAQQQHLGDAKSLHVTQHITVLSLELHVKTRIDLRPDPDMDEIRCLFYCLESDSWTGSEKGMRTGVIVVDPESVSKNETSPDVPCTSTSAALGVRKERELLKKSGVTSLEVLYVQSEVELFLQFAQLMHQWDPDILVGYEVQMLSWGFLLQRAAHLRCDLCRAISRVPADEQRNKYQAVNDAYGADNASELHIVGRVVLNMWRLMRTELALYDYSFESIAYHMLHERYPAYDHRTLTNWFDPPLVSGLVNHCHRWRVMDYFVSRVQGNMRLLMQQDFIGRTSELARVFGIQFYEVLTRGSQFRVESMLLRTARAHNFVAVTPSILQRAQMRAPEVIALVMEPESKFYHVPVVVVDFQSLYPSMVIAYNICYSTCLGRVEYLGSDAIFTFGCTSLRVPAKTLNKLIRKNLITINPSGVAFVKSKVRRGVMPQMLDEILTTRIMVKNSMKKLKPGDSATKHMLDHRQLGLKLIANVTYGYTAANFSGRMPCVEVGDSIVHKARETLERAIQLVTRNSSKWENARVVYGDTDSMFIALEGINKAGCSKARAFEVGREICAAVTADNPTPVKLRFEKVYLPCVLQTKKRYVGYAFESEDQKEPIFDAKGIETVRRDGTPATSKILEKTLKVLFDTRDVSQVKQYVLKQCGKLLDGRTTLQDCIIAKEYRGKQYYKPGAIVPALQIARKSLALDRRSEPRVGERVPYVVVHGAPGTPLYQLVKSPLDVLRDPTLQLNGAYYVTKQVLPALDRMLSLLGVDVFLWHKFIPRTMHLTHNATLDDSQVATTKKATISQFFKSKHCLVCKRLSIRSICENCLVNDGAKQRTAVSLTMEATSLERSKHDIDKICMQCTGAYSASEIRCVSLDCSILYKSFRAAYNSSKVKSLRKALEKDDLF